MKKGKTSISDWMSNARVEFSRDHAHDHTSSSLPKAKRRKPARTASRNDSAPVPSVDVDLPWVTKYTPNTVADLAVHKKKVLEVQQWLEFALSVGSRHPMLLLTGPPGCGKTATLHALANDLHCSIVEWVNPITDAGGAASEDLHAGDRVLFPESQPKQFRNFILRANRYPSLLLSAGDVASDANTTCKKIVLVEEFPNAFLKDPSKFYQVMRSLQKSLCSPLVFIVSESHAATSSAAIFRNKEHSAHLAIHTITFNPVAHTSLVKTLHKVASVECQLGTGKGRGLPSSRSQEQLKYFMPPKEVLEQLSESCNGDVRSAINSLQFLCLKDCSDILCFDDAGATRKHQAAKAPPPSTASQPRSKSTTAAATKMSRHHSGCEVLAQLSGIGSRDTTLFLFRALGKILYFKRDAEQSVEDSLPVHLKEHERPPLLVIPEVVVESSHVSPNLFVLYLHENYSDFFSDLDDMANALQYLSDSDILSRMWSESQEERVCVQEYSSSVACRGLIHCNRSSAPPKWRPLHKPQWNSVFRQYQECSASARGLFLHLHSAPHAHLWTRVELQTEILPYMAVINTRLRNSDQVSLLQSMTHFKSRNHRYQIQHLGERDIEAEPGTSNRVAESNVSNSQNTLSQNTLITDREELHASDSEIQDFDDDDDDE